MALVDEAGTSVTAWTLPTDEEALRGETVAAGGSG
jgi:hypothetical protein